MLFPPLLPVGLLDADHIGLSVVCEPLEVASLVVVDLVVVQVLYLLLVSLHLPQLHRPLLLREALVNERGVSVVWYRFSSLHLIIISIY